MEILREGYRAPSRPWSPASPTCLKAILLTDGNVLRPERREAVTLLVDSGSTYTWVAAAVLRALFVVPTERRRSSSSR